jgi:hypothetical protein
MNIPFTDRNPSEIEFERFRLILSTYQDGSGQQSLKNGGTLPGWRDFERAVASAFGGESQENKYIFDVLIPDMNRKNVFVGISCKMRRTLNDTKRNGRVTLELSNSSGKFWDRLMEKGIHQQNYKSKPGEVARVLLTQVEEWHQHVGQEQGGRIDLARSYYLALSWNHQGEYQLFKFSLQLPTVDELVWDFPSVSIGGQEKLGRRLRGIDKLETAIEWYGESGGQLKYYPLAENALWKSEVFRLESLPDNWQEKHGVFAKARDYFPILWGNVL